MTYYNDNDKRICAWLRELIRQGCISDGVVDDRPIQEVRAVDLVGYERVHFFAGIGGWDHALNLAGFTGPVWTGSCPCQPFSNAGERMGVDDERHLWPVFRELVRECSPTTVFGEQVASKDGRAWLSGVFSDLEEMGYIRAGADLCAAGIGAPHVRQRLYWMAHSSGKRVEELVCFREGSASQEAPRWEAAPLDARLCVEEWMGIRQGLGEPGLLPSIDGIPETMGPLRGYGNAILPQVAAHFIQASLEAIADASCGRSS